MPAARSPLHTWLQLFRAPNLFTVPGDPIAGFLLSGPFFLVMGPRFAAAVVASLCFYGAGLLLNDLMDLDEDRAERPDRPLPSGSAQPKHVWLATLALNAAGLALCAAGGLQSLAVGAGIVVAVAAYDCGLKKIPVAGVLTMGVCRGLSVLLGAAFGAGFSLPALAAAAITTLYIAAVTHLARFETRASAPGYAFILPAIGPILALIAGLTHTIPTRLFGAVVLALAIADIALTLLRVLTTKLPLPPAIGSLIRALLLFQAFYCDAASGGRGWSLALMLIGLWPISREVSKKFYAS